jgi:hypothetical protein
MRYQISRTATVMVYHWGNNFGGNVMVTNGTENSIQFAYCTSQESRTKVLITRRDSEVLMTQKLSYSVNVGAAHS